MNEEQVKELTALIAAGDVKKILDYVSDMVQDSYDDGYSSGVADTEE